MSKRRAFADFNPSFATLGFGWAPLLFEEAFEDGASKLDPRLDTIVGATATEEGVIGHGVERSLRFGHLPDNTDNIAADLSGAAPYKLILTFDEQDKLISVKLILFLLNPRVILTDGLFIPSKRADDGRFEPLTSGAAPCGLRLVADPGVSPHDRFEALKSGLPHAAFGNVPNGALAFSEDTLNGRLDLSIEWKDDTLGRKSADLFGRVIGLPDAALPDQVNVTAVELFSPALPTPLKCLMDVTKTIGVELAHDHIGGVEIIMRPPADPRVKRMLNDALAEFNLKEDFKGVLFEGIRAHWLDDRQYGQENWPSIGLSLTAFSFDSAGQSKTFSKWYASFEATMPEPQKDGYLNLLTHARLHATFSEDKVSNFTLSGTFRELDHPYAWLKGKRATLSLHIESWKDNNGQEHKGSAVSLGLEGTDDTILTTLTKDAPVRMSAETFSQIAVALTLAPIVLSSNPVKAPDGAHAPNDKTRGYFVPIRGRQGLAQLYTGLALGWFFRNAVSIDQLRVVGVRLQRQPAAVNDSSLDPDLYQTALLFDYEVDYKIAIEDAEIKTTRALTARVDGTGFSLEDKDVVWVQVPSGIRELSVADPSLWSLGPLGKFLKIVDMSIRRAPQKQLVVRLRLMGNTNILTAGDFVFVIPLEGDERPKIEAFPSEITVDIPGVVKGTGTLVISEKDNAKTVIGSLDLVFPSGFRLYGAVRVTQVEGTGKSVATAMIFGAKVHFKTPIPVFGTGIGWTGIEGIVATHFKRLEPAGDAVVPPALAWLESVKGDVVESIKLPGAWAVEHDRSSVGLGVTLELITGGNLLNLNAMLVVEQPGPRILIFAKANLLKKPVDNKDASDDLKRGIIGVLDVDLAKDEITLSALANIEFKEFVKIRAPLQLYFDLHQASNWHLYLGHHSARATATLSLFDIASLTASGYIMAAGSVIKDFPIAPDRRQDLPGFAVAAGAGASVQIGGGSLYVRGSIDTYVAVALSHGLYVAGSVLLSGELRLFIVTLGASAELKLQYLRSIDGAQGLFLSGEICGHFKSFFIEIEGCISLEIGAPIEDPPTLPILTERASLLSGANVALRGQGRLGPIDAILAEGAVVGTGTAPPSGVPLDVVIALSMAQPPKIGASPVGFAAVAPPFNQNETRFNIASRKGQYVLKSVLLQRRKQDGSLEDVDYSASPARWWESGQSSKGGQPTPKVLALMTRNPLSAQNVIVDPDQLKSWIKSIVGGVCDPVIPPQACWYSLYPEDAGVPADGAWWVPAVLRDAATEIAVGRTGASPFQFELGQRPFYGHPDDPIPGYPRFPGSCIVESDPVGLAPVPVLSLYSRVVATQRNVRVNGRAVLRGDMLPGSMVDLLMAHTPLEDDYYLNFRVETSHGNVAFISYKDLKRAGSVRNLIELDVQKAFHEGAAHWVPPTEAFSRLSELPRYTQFEFTWTRIDLSALGLEAGEYPTSLNLELSNDVPLNLEISAILGGCRIVPLAEEARFENDRKHKQGTIDGLKDFFDDRPVPLLEPDTLYQVRIEWDSLIEGSAAASEYKEFEFKTTSEPPASASSYLLATFPQAGERFHCSEDTPGFCLGSTDAFRIFAKFPDLRLKVTITEDGGAQVFNSTKALRWDQGALVAPSELTDPVQPPPVGFFKDTVASLPSALKDALYQRVRDGSLVCLGPINLPDSGIWIGFDVELLALTGYRIAVEVVHADGSKWVWTDPAFGESAPFLEWRFSTALHRNLAGHVAQLKAGRIRHKMLAGMFSLQFSNEGLEPIVVPEKRFEDALAAALEERPDRGGEARLTVLWRLEQAEKVLKAYALLIESREPLLRTTRSVRIGPLSEIAPDTSVAEPQDLLLQSFDPGQSQRVSGICCSSSGFAALIKIDETSAEDLRIVLARRAVERIPATKSAFATLEIPASTLAPRPVPQI